MPVANPVGLAVTDRLVFVVPDVGVTLSHAGTFCWLYATVSPKAIPLLALDTASDWAAVGVVEPVVAVKVNDDGVSEIALVVATTRFTVMTTGVVLAPDGVKVTVPVYVPTPRTAGNEGLTLIVTDPGVLGVEV